MKHLFLVPLALLLCGCPEAHPLEEVKIVRTVDEVPGFTGSMAYTVLEFSDGHRETHTGILGQPGDKFKARRQQ